MLNTFNSQVVHKKRSFIRHQTSVCVMPNWYVMYSIFQFDISHKIKLNIESWTLAHKNPNFKLRICMEMMKR